MFSQKSKWSVATMWKTIQVRISGVIFITILPCRAVDNSVSHV